MTGQLCNQSTRWWQPTDQMIEKWLKDRQALLVIYYQLFDTPTKTLTLEKQALTEFCEALIDYVSFGHFRVFEKLAEAEVRAADEMQTFITPKAELERDNNLIVKILRTTLSALDFNDKYADHSQANAIDLEKDLSLLGEQLAHRLDWEDELINRYFATTKRLEAGQTQVTPF